MGTPSVVFDTNVIVSGVGFGGKPRESLSLAFDGTVQMVVSTETFHELVLVLEYDRLSIPRDTRDEFAGKIADIARFVDANEDFEVVDSDPDDDKFLECAVTADADFVVSGDTDLIEIDQFRGVSICSPDYFLEAMAERDSLEG